MPMNWTNIHLSDAARLRGHLFTDEWLRMTTKSNLISVALD